MTYNLRTFQYACIPNDDIQIIFEFAKKDFFEGADMCFDNNAYKTLDDFPFVVNNNCWARNPTATSGDSDFNVFQKCHF